MKFDSVIIWPVLSRNGNNPIKEFDWPNNGLDCMESDM